MSVLPILRWPDARLNLRCAPVVEDVRDLAANMLETMYAATGRGLAAPQVGVMLRLFVMDARWKTGQPDPQVFVNPKIIWRSDRLVKGPEGCLSLPGLTTTIARSDHLRLCWQDLNGSAQEQVFSGFESICTQHECDHLDGILTLDHLDVDDRARAEKELV